MFTDVRCVKSRAWSRPCSCQRRHYHTKHKSFQKQLGRIFSAENYAVFEGIKLTNNLVL